ncbi:MAG: glycosyltransferase family protein [Lachnospiraceae bacterium]|nr:glycosyltransferase family protein [Lachnospiraceae bacterium]
MGLFERLEHLIPSAPKKKFGFVISVSNEMLFKEAELYIHQLKVPDGYTVEIIPVRGASSMANAFNQAIAQSDASIKIYMHQDVSIINPNFLNDVLTIFGMDNKIGMIGVLGSPKVPASGVPWHGPRVGNLYALDAENAHYEGYAYRPEDGLTEVETLEGFLMVTRTDLPWREDLLQGWSYYDMSQSFEFRRKGYKLVVPEMKKPWIAHDTGITNLWKGYNDYRNAVLREYAEFF